MNAMTEHAPPTSTIERSDEIQVIKQWEVCFGEGIQMMKFPGMAMSSIELGRAYAFVSPYKKMRLIKQGKRHFLSYENNPTYL